MVEMVADLGAVAVAVALAGLAVMVLEMVALVGLV
jgi:hypothetical protein